MCNRINNHLPRTFVDYSTRQSVEARVFPSEEILLSWAILFATSLVASERNSDIAELGQPPVLDSVTGLNEPSHPTPKNTLTIAAQVKRLYTIFISFGKPKPRHNVYQRKAGFIPHKAAVGTSFRKPYVNEGYRSMIDAALDKESVAYSNSRSMSRDLES